MRASFFWLLASVRDDTPWAPSPGGLSSDGYSGHVFWDNETWMYPSMLATEPTLAKQMLQYRVDRVAAARQNAQLTGYQGARFPWESALSGLEETPSCCLRRCGIIAGPVCNCLRRNGIQWSGCARSFPG